MKTRKPTRRDFFKAAAVGAAAFPAIVPSSVLAARAAASAPSDRIVLGFIGVGKQGSFLLRGFMNEPCHTGCRGVRHRQAEAPGCQDAGGDFLRQPGGVGELCRNHGDPGISRNPREEGH